jgi:uncharacterized membrane protein
MHLLAVIFTFLAALCCGLIAGLFFAFSNFVMKVMLACAPGEGWHRMQAINRTVLNGPPRRVFGTAGSAAAASACCGAGSRRRLAAGRQCALSAGVLMV